MTTAATRSAAVWVPDWPVVAALQAAGQELHLPAVVLGQKGVVAASAAARALGVRRGMRKRTAQGMCPSLLTLPVDPGRDAIEFEPVAVAAESVVAGLEVIRPGLALLPASGAARYYGTELELTSQLTEAVSVAGFECQVGIADGILAAVVAAQEQVIVPPGGSAQFLAPRPITDLTAAHPVDFQQLAEALSLWARLGLRTLGDLVALPAAAVAARFGEIGVWARRLAAGGDLRPPSARLVTADVTVSLELDPPAQQVEAAMLAGQQLAQDFAAVMLERSLACGRIRISATTENGQRNRVWRTDDGALGGMNAGQLTRRLRWQLDSWLTERASSAGQASSSEADLALGPAPVTALAITAEEVTDASTYQSGLWGSNLGQDQRARRALEQVQTVLGVDQVLGVRLQGGRTPAERVQSFTFAELPPPARPLSHPWPDALPDPAPTRWYQNPLPVQLSDGERLVQVDARTCSLTAAPQTLQLGNKLVTVINWAGPWLVPVNWWEGEKVKYYLQVVTESQALLLQTALLLPTAGVHWEAIAEYG